MAGGDRKLLGRWGEVQAAKWLRDHGHRLVQANWRCRFGEIDIIAQHGMHVVFVEVKARKNENFAQAREFVTRSKQERVIKTAMMWLQQNDVDLQPRFDVIEVVGEGRTQQIRHLENAFE